MTPSLSMRSSASSSYSPPRALFTKNAVGFISRYSRSPIMPLVWSVSGVCSVT